MRLDELYRAGKPDLSFELFPPKTPEGVETLFRETIPRLNRFRPAFFSMTYGAGGTTRDLTLELCDRMKNEARVETMCHLNVIGQSRDESRENLRRIKQAGVYNLLALRGDPPRDEPGFKPHPDGFTSSLELIEEARQVETGGAASSSRSHQDPFFSIAVTGFPEVHPEASDRASDIEYLKRKVEAGGCVVITQFFLDSAYFGDFLGEAGKAGITAPIVPGILPILSAAQVHRFAKLCGATIPSAVSKALARYEQDDEGAVQYGIELATRLCRELLKAGVPGLHFYALNRARSAEAILTNLGLAPS